LKKRVDLTEFDIKFVGLSVGKHDFQFKIDANFISKFQDALIEQLDILLNFTLNKQSESLFLLEFAFSGYINLECDRCLQEFQYPVEQINKMILKIENGKENMDDDIIFVSSNEIKVNIAEYVYEFVSLLIPMKKTCELISRQCDDEMIQVIKNYSVRSESENNTDNHWNILRKLKNN
jgi:uncharacterized metal-binding protein YceD (DUF177 family)